MIKKALHQLPSKLLFAGFLFAFYSCGTPTTTTETTTEADTTEVQQTANTGANTETENLEYAEKAEATTQAIAFYELLKNGLYENTIEMVDQNMYKDFSKETWIAILKKQETEKGKLEKYALQTSKYEKVEGTNNGRKVEFTFEVTRNGTKHIEKMDWYKTDGEPFLIIETEYSGKKSSEEDDD